MAVACFRGTLPPREFYRLAPRDTAPNAATLSGAPPLTAAVGIRVYDTPGIYGSGALVYRAGATSYGEYPSREWAIPLGEMLGALTQDILEQRALTSGRVEFNSPGTSDERYEWRGAVREFDEVDSRSSVSATVALAARLVRVADDSVVWSGFARETLPVAQARSMDAVVAALSAAAARAIARLADEAASELRRLAASRAQER